MRNVTVAVSDEIFRSARVYAAKQDTSVSALVAAYLRTLADSDDEFTRLVELQERTLDTIQDFRASDRLTRDEVHNRALR